MKKLQFLFCFVQNVLENYFHHFMKISFLIMVQTLSVTISRLNPSTSTKSNQKMKHMCLTLILSTIFDPFFPTTSRLQKWVSL